jgi:alkylhydroperoxidase/carboxymuconolactone decarboxylase family protein YurZ
VDKPLPKSVSKFADEYPGIWRAFNELARECHEEGGPLDDRERRLAKLGIAIGAQREGGVHSATRLALQSGLSADEILHVALLSVTTIGWPGSQAALTWVRDILSEPADAADSGARE